MDSSPASHLDDEALSADLDAALGEGAAASPDESVASHLAGCARCAERREQLAAARAALAAAPVEPVDELTRRRFLAGALAEAADASPPGLRRWHRHPALAGAVAAAILTVLVAVPFLTREEGTGEKSSATAGSAEEVAAATFLGDLGDVASPDVIRARLGAPTERKAVAGHEAGDATVSAETDSPMVAAAPPPSTVPPAVPAAPAPLPLHQSSGSEAARTRDFAAQAPTVDPMVTRQCTTTLLSGPARGARLVAEGVGTLRGTPVVVSVFAGPTGTTAYITARDGCELLQRYSI